MVNNNVFLVPAMAMNQSGATKAANLATKHKLLEFGAL